MAEKEKKQNEQIRRVFAIIRILIKRRTPANLNDIGNEVERISTRENFLNESESYFTNESGLQLSDNINHRVQLKLDHKIDSTQDVRLTSNIGFNKSGCLPKK